MFPVVCTGTHTQKKFFGPQIFFSISHISTNSELLAPQLLSGCGAPMLPANHSIPGHCLL